MENEIRVIMSKEDYHRINDKAEEFDKIMKLPNCNTCKIMRDCKLKPNWGGFCVFNCPLHVKGSD